jgi:hypothetical protein
MGTVYHAKPNTLAMGTAGPTTGPPHAAFHFG